MAIDLKLGPVPFDRPSSGEDAGSSGPGRASAHPDFSTHFTSVIYDPDDNANDETAPFGGDEGADVYAAWAERVDELERLTLRGMLELDEDPSSPKSAPSALDEITIAAGFVHLRATGWIDHQGAAWLRAALERSDRNDPGAEFATMLQDLTTYSNRPPTVRRPPAKRGWLQILTGSGDRPLTQWCRATETAMATDPEWSSWWATVPMATLDFYPHLDSKKAHVAVEQEGQVLVVTASTPTLGRITRKHVGGVVYRDTPPLPSLMTLPNYRETLESLLLSALKAAADKKQLQAPPAHLPD